MSLPTISFWTALVLDVAMGLIVFWANNRRTANQYFLALSIVLSGWLICIGKAMTAVVSSDAEFWIRQASASGVFIPTSFNLLRLAIVERNPTWWGGSTQESDLDLLKSSGCCSLPDPFLFKNRSCARFSNQQWQRPGP